MNMTKFLIGCSALSFFYNPSIFGLLLFTGCTYVYVLINFIYAQILSYAPTFVLFLHKLNSADLNSLVFLIVFGMVLVVTGCLQPSLNLSLLVMALTFTTLTLATGTLVPFKCWDLTSERITPTLTNGLLNLHPAVLYVFYSGLLILCWYTVYGYRTQSVRAGYVYNAPYFSISFYALGMVALLLGAWWSYQELNWGGFWSWDLVEVFLLITVLFMVIVRHLLTLNTLVFRYTLLFSLNFVLYIVSVSYNLINSIHNFIIQDALEYNSTYFLSAYVVLFLICGAATSNLRNGNSLRATYYYLGLILESSFILLSLYVVAVYLLFYAFNTSTVMLLSLVTSLFYALLGAVFISFISLTSLYYPIGESVFIGFFFSSLFSNGWPWVLHICVCIGTLSLLVWYGLIVLNSEEVSQCALNVIGYCSYSISNIVFAVLPGTYGNQLMLNSSEFYVDLTVAYQLLNSAYTLVIYSTPYFYFGLSWVYFSHKSFSNLSFLENFVGLFLVLIGFWVRHNMSNNTLFF